MANVVLNFSSQWPTVQVAKVLYDPENNAEASSNTWYTYQIPHNLGFPPLAIGMTFNTGPNQYRLMQGMDVDENNVYFDPDFGIGEALECIVIYSIDISDNQEYKQYESATGTVLQDTSGGELDLRNFLLHSRSVGPMVLNVINKEFVIGVDEELSYSSPLDYPTFNFGFFKMTGVTDPSLDGVWWFAPLQSQGFPRLQTDGFDSLLQSSGGIASGASIVTLRNPAIITDNTTNVTI